jgi:hypothetical protein
MGKSVDVDEALKTLEVKSTETIVRKRGNMLSIKFGRGEEDQKQAHEFMSVFREAVFDDEEDDGEPFHTDPDGTPVYRILLYGLHWGYGGDKGSRLYRAIDGSRHWVVSGNSGNSKWTAALHEEGKDPRILGTEYKTMRAARTAAEEAARRMPEG